MRQPQIRPANLDDARAIAELHVRSFLATYEHLTKTRQSAESGLEGRIMVWADRLEQPETTTLVAVRDEEVVGFVHIGPSPDDDADETTGHVISVHVDPDQTGSGTGGTLIDAAVSALAADGYWTATLWALSQNERAQRFYSRHGWRNEGVTRIVRLSVGEEEGDEVEVVRFRVGLVASEGESQ